MGMMSALVYYVIPGLLGRAYDMKNETVGPDLFHLNDTQNARVIERYVTTSEYRMVSDLSEVNDFLDVDGKLSLKLKTGSMSLEGTGHYLKETTSFQNQIDLLVKVHYETVILTLPSGIKPLPGWEKSIERTGSTHYIRSIQYGGDLIASISFNTNNKHDKELIQGEIQGELGSSSGSFGIGLEGKLKKIQKETSNFASMNINYYATVPLNNVPRTIEGLISLVEKFPEQTKNINNGRGVPLEMEVFSLESLSMNKTSYYQTQAFAGLLDLLDEQFTDIRNARRRLNDWTKTIPPVLDDEMNQKISNFTTELDELDKIFSQVIANIDLSEDASEDQFQLAFSAYQGEEKISYPNFYVNKLSFLKKEVLLNTPAFEVDFGGSSYIYYGNDQCPPSANFTFKGTVATSTQKSIGSSKFICLPEDKQLLPDQGRVEDFHSLTQVMPVAFNSRRNGTMELVFCSSCRIPGKTSVTMLPGFKTCPQGWTKQYEGVLASTDFRSPRGELICLNNVKKTEVERNVDVAVITEVSASCGNFPCTDQIKSDKAIQCVVCSVEKNITSKEELYRI